MSSSRSTAPIRLAVAKIAAQSILKKPVTLQFRDANIRMVFEALSRTTGLNVIFDRDVRVDLKTTIFVRDASVEDTVDLILLQSQLEKKVLNANTMFLYPATVAKQKEYQDLKVRTFQVSNGDAKYLQTMLKSVLKVKEVALDERTNTLVLRDTADAVAVAEKIIAAHDLADPEVTLEVELLEVSRDRLTNLGVKWPDSATVTTPTGPGGNLTLEALRNISTQDLLITPLSLSVNLKLQDTDANLLASPRIRTRQQGKGAHPDRRQGPGDHQHRDAGQLGQLRGDRQRPVPRRRHQARGRAVCLFRERSRHQAQPRGQQHRQGDLRSAGVAGLPDRHTQRYDKSSVARWRDPDHRRPDQRLRSQYSLTRCPGWANCRSWGDCSRNHAGNSVKTEIIMSITPRIVRAQATANAAMRDVYSGTEATVRELPLRLDPVGAVSGSAAALPSVAPGAPRAAPPAAEGIDPASQPASQPASGAKTPAPVAGKPGTGASSSATGAGGTGAAPGGVSTGEPATRAPVPVENLPPSVRPGGIYQPAQPPQPPTPKGSPGPAPPDETVDAGAAAAVAEAAPAGGAAKAGSATAATRSSAPIAQVPTSDSALELAWQGPYRVKVGQEFQVALEVTSNADLKRLPIVVHFDPVVLTFLDAQFAEFASKSGIDTAQPEVDTQRGRITFDLQAGPGKSFQGKGILLNLRFSARSPRQQTQLTLTKIDLRDDKGAIADAVRPTPLTLRVGS